MKRIGITIAIVAGLCLGGAPARSEAATTEDVETMELMLHGLMAVHASTVLSMNAHVAGLLKPDHAVAEIGRNTKFLEVLKKSCDQLERKTPLDAHDQISFIKDFKQVCYYLETALEWFDKFVAEGKEIDSKLVDRNILHAERAMGRLLKGLSGD